MRGADGQDLVVAKQAAAWSLTPRRAPLHAYWSLVFTNTAGGTQQTILVFPNL